ncbi:LuxR family transcriptional regulator [Paractinoplanes durhamensis]|uniref:LuxR family transcriptional regulator n=1 Tax=Paractinoplanes durhamensis TaxID=113563 RepID=A0ABQ3Z498_9ACTN|nr:LuxR family transcriptional regulator [Actinoplanes durhamensis]GIE04658.1 LuxR family transcriptional regulator [Actinoplanes durhamensis]
MDLLERDDELAALGRLLAECAAGGRVAVISGEAGAGKSSLAAAFAEAAGPRAHVVRGACDPLLTPRALGPLHDIARALGGRLRDRIADAPRVEVFDLFLEALDRPPQAACPVVVLEDLHWADEATLDMIAFLGRRLALCRALLLITYREEEIAPDHRLRTVLAGLPPGLTRRVSLPPLSAAAVGELARRAGRDAPGVHAVTGGNPLLVTEVLAATAEGIPPTVRDLVLSRLATLGEPARDVARLVSVVPAHVPAGLLAGRVAAVDECLAAGMLTAKDDGVAFRHELLRLAVEESLSPVRRMALHAEVLAALSDRPGVDPARLVHHAHHAGDVPAVLRWAPVAARRAAALGAYRQAAAHYATALPLTEDHPPAERAELLEEYSSATYHGGLSGAAIDARRRALALRERLGDPLGIGTDLRWVSRLLWWNGRPDEARAAAWRAVRVLESVPPGRELAAAYSNLSQLFMLAGELPEAISWGRRALELALLVGDRDTELHAMVNIGSARFHGGDRAGIAELERAHEQAAAAGLDDHAGRALVNLGTIAVDAGDFGTADATFARMVPFLAARDLDGYMRHVLGHRARLELFRGDWQAALDDAEQGLTGPPVPGPSLVPAIAVRLTVRARLGETGLIDEARDAAERAYRGGEIQFVGPAAILLTELYWLAGDDERAAAEARRGMVVAERPGAGGQPWFLGELAFWLWRCGGLTVPPPGVAEPYRLAIAGEWQRAAAWWRARGCPYPEAEALSGGDPAAALRIYDRLGAVPAARRLRARMRDQGLPVPRGPRPATAADPTGLTGRQREVLALLAEGLSNADIAARLTLSAKTVDHHVSAVLTKLGVPNRGQAAAAARRLNIGSSPHVPGGADS